MPARGPTCTLATCKAKANPIIGGCSCGGVFCASHRQPEDHSCGALADMKSMAKALNASKLESEATAPNKGL
jgi:predicted nucleic acid binding AN1-type Zn finger protein